jgi:hypothetical protein
MIFGGEAFRKQLSLTKGRWGEREKESDEEEKKKDEGRREGRKER